MTETVILVRHGETALNADGRLRGLADPPLNEVGEAQAVALGVALASVGAKVVISSPLLRAVRTATLIGEGAGIAPRADEGFNDRDYGDFTGELESVVIDRWGSVDAAPGVEPTTAVLDRVRPALDACAAESAAVGGPVIVVTHDAVIRPLLADIDASMSPPQVHTGSYQVLERQDCSWTATLLDQRPPLVD